MKRIALDLDGVLINTIGKFVEVWNKIRGDNKTLNDVTRFGFYEDWGMSEAAFWSLFDVTKHETLEAIDLKAPKYIKKLFKHYDIDIVTARKESERGLIESCLDHIGIKQGIHYNNIVITPRLGDTPKIDYPYDIYIDDNPNLATDIKAIQQWEDRVLLLWQHPWNWQVESGLGVYRVSGWKSIMKWFENNNI